MPLADPLLPLLLHGVASHRLLSLVVLTELGPAAALMLTTPLLLGGSVMAVGLGRRTGIDGAARGMLLRVTPLGIALGLLVGYLLVVLLPPLLQHLGRLLGPLRLRPLVQVGEGQPLEVRRVVAVGKGLLLLLLLLLRVLVVMVLHGFHTLRGGIPLLLLELRPLFLLVVKVLLSVVMGGRLLLLLLQDQHRRQLPGAGDGGSALEPTPLIETNGGLPLLGRCGGL